MCLKWSGSTSVFYELFILHVTLTSVTYVYSSRCQIRMIYTKLNMCFHIDNVKPLLVKLLIYVGTMVHGMACNCRAAMPLN